MKKVCIRNNGSRFRGLIGTAERQKSGMYKVTFDVARDGYTYSLFFDWELEPI